MQLAAGTRLGPYEIVAPAGAGGMAEVYRARDTRLDRNVAVKILPAQFATNVELRARFEREAKTISSLNHPHICALYDVGEETNGGVQLHYIVMEYLEGETLENRLLKGPLPVDQLLRIGTEIADALDKAHRRGIVHRDLKPGNVMLTKSGAKLLDFGLAKTAVDPISSSDGDPTRVRNALTQEGSIVGTFHYMSPEQLEGQPVDARSDVFALGTLLYEMATGKRAFEGKSRAGVIAAILETEPKPISQVRPMVSPALDRVVQMCLAKDPDERWQTAHDVMLQLRWIQESGSQAGVAAPVARRRINRERTAWTCALVAAVAALALGVGIVRRAPHAAPVVQFYIDTPLHTTLFPFDTLGMSLSPDGSRLAFPAIGDDGKQLLYVRKLRTNRSTPLPGTDGASYPFWSPDSRSIGFFANRKMNKIDAAGGPVQAICDAPLGRGATWNDDGVIVFAPTIISGLFRVSAEGGAPTQATWPKEKMPQHRWPSFLPDGRHFIFVDGSDLFGGSLDSHATTMLIHDASNAVFAPPDRLLFMRNQVLMSQRFDPDKLRMKGEAAPLEWGPVSYWPPKRFSPISASENGTLAFLPPLNPISQLAWIDRNGHQVATAGEPGEYGDATLSPDGSRIAVIKQNSAGGDIWIVDVRDGRWSRLTFQPGAYRFPRWTRDGKQLAFMYEIGGFGQPFTKPLDGGATSPIVHTAEFTGPLSYSPDGKTLLIWRQGAQTSWDLYSITLGDDAAMKPFLVTPFDETAAVFSPDGKWVAYVSNASMRTEVYLRRFPATDEQWQISTSGGLSPMWSPNGHELYYVAGNTVMAVPIAAGANPNPGTATSLFRIPGRTAAPTSSLSAARQIFGGITPDGQRFLIRMSTDQSLPQINVVLNWQSALKPQDR